jgi:hypothetical protein
LDILLHPIFFILVVFDSKMFPYAFGQSNIRVQPIGI